MEVIHDSQSASCCGVGPGVVAVDNQAGSADGSGMAPDAAGGGVEQLLRTPYEGGLVDASERAGGGGVLRWGTGSASHPDRGIGLASGATAHERILARLRVQDFPDEIAET